MNEQLPELTNEERRIAMLAAKDAQPNLGGAPLDDAVAAATLSNRMLKFLCHRLGVAADSSAFLTANHSVMLGLDDAIDMLAARGIGAREAVDAIEVALRMALFCNQYRRETFNLGGGLGE